LVHNATSGAARLVVGMSGIELPNRLRDLLTKKIRDKAPWYPSSTWLFDDNVGSATYPRDAVEVARTVVEELMKTAPENITEVWLLAACGVSGRR